ncbi:MAG: helix-turn-helix transcriptional regulator [Victivallales bacterium]|nr:helix-turn-helix transcriptional regulator [Victivallales bacterium]
MAYISYKKLWHQLIDRDISKTELRNATGISSSTLANMVNGHNVSLEVLMKICVFLQCDLSDVVTIMYGTSDSKDKSYSENFLRDEQSCTTK